MHDADDHIMKPYAQRGFPDGKRIFNYRLTIARRTGENAFAILADVFRIFFTRMNVTELASSISLACCILHNLLRTLSLESYTPRHSVDNGEITEGEWRNEDPSPYFTELAPTQGRKAFYEAEDIRDNFKEYFNSNGAVPWQYKHIYTN